MKSGMNERMKVVKRKGVFCVLYLDVLTGMMTIVSGLSINIYVPKKQDVGMGDFFRKM